MKGLKKQRRIQIIALAGAAVLGLLAVLWFLPDQAFQFFRSPSEVVEAPPAPNEVFRLVPAPKTLLRPSRQCETPRLAPAVRRPPR